MAIHTENVQIFGDTATDGKKAAAVDSLHLAIVAMDEIHRQIHKGLLYEITYSETKAAGASIDLLVICPADKAVHTRIHFQSASASRLQIYRNPSYGSPAGASITPINLNDRAFASAASSTWIISNAIGSPTGGDDVGVFPIFDDTGVGQRSTGGASGIFIERILREGYSYLFRFTNDDPTLSKEIWFDNIFYEQDI